MQSVKDLQGIIDRIRSDAPPAELRVLLRHASPLVRVNALEALVGHARNDVALLNEMIAAASSPVNKVVLMGTISVAHVAVACLLRVASVEAADAAKRLLEHWPEPDRADLLWYLKSEGLEAPIEVRAGDSGA